MSQDMRDDAVYHGNPSPALLVGNAPGITEAEGKAVDDPSNFGFVADEPGQRRYRPGDQENAIAVSRPKRLDIARQHRRNGNGREIVIGKRGMASMAGEEDCVIGFTWDQQLVIAEMATHQIGVEDHTVALVTQARHLTVCEAEAPVFRVIGSAIWNPVGLIGYSIRMRSQIRKRRSCIDRPTVLDNVGLFAEKSTMRVSAVS